MANRMMPLIRSPRQRRCPPETLFVLGTSEHTINPPSSSLPSPMSIRPEAQLPFDRSEWGNLARSRLRWGANTRVTKNCGHNFCDLTQPRCCSCIDTRPIRERYYKYVDGRGMVLEGKRWSNYCPGCQIQFGEPEESEPDAMQEVRRESSFTEMRCAHCGRAGHYVWECPRNNLNDAEPSNSHHITTTTAPPSPAVSRASSATTFHQRNLIPPSPGEYRPRTTPVFGIRQSVDVNRTPHEHSHGFYFGGRGPHPTASERTPAPSTPTPPTPSPPSLSPPRPVPRLTTHEQRRARIQANYERTFGSLRDIANDPEYVSPLSFMYGNAYARFQEREAERRQQAESVETDSTQTRPRREPDYYFHYHDIPPSFRVPEGSPPSSPPPPPAPPQQHQLPRLEPQPRIESTARTPTTTRDTQQILESLRRRLEEDDRRLLVNPDNEDSTPELFAHRQSIFGRWYDMPNDESSPAFLSTRHRDFPAPPRPKTPEPISKEDLTILNECKVCFSQHCDMLLLPCAHLVLCEVSPLSLKELLM